jgi:uncharacterized protein YbjT (DUF2867 family)
MNNINTIFVTGATGNQGGAVARSLLKNGFSVKALTRNATSAKAQQLKQLGAEVIQGDLNNPQSFSSHLKDVQGVFSVQAFTDGIEKEIQQGKLLADIAKQQGVSHFLYTSVSGADLHTGIPHWDSKHVIENHIKQSGLSFTIVRPTSLFENFLIPQVHSRLLKGKLVTPVNKNKVQQFVGSHSVGELSVRVFTDPEKYKGQTITLAAEEMDNEQVAALFTKVLGKQITYQKLPMLITRLFMGKDLYKMFKWINENDVAFVKELHTFKNEHPYLQSLDEWIKTKFVGKAV